MLDVLIVGGLQAAQDIELSSRIHFRDFVQLSILTVQLPFCCDECFCESTRVKRRREGSPLSSRVVISKLIKDHQTFAFVCAQLPGMFAVRRNSYGEAVRLCGVAWIDVYGDQLCMSNPIQV